MRKLPMLLAGAVCLAAMTGCGPKYATESEVRQYVSSYVPEETVLIGTSESDPHTFRYRCTGRDLEFNVWSVPHSIDIDGAVLGYSGDYHITDDYTDQQYAYYNDVMTKLLRKHRFIAEDETMFDYSGDHDDLMCRHMENSGPYPGDENYAYCKRITFVFSNATYDWDYRYGDAFLEDVRKEILQKEYDTTGTALDFSYDVWLKDTWGGTTTYYRTIGTNSDYTSFVEHDQEVHIHDTVTPIQDGWRNVTPAVYHGLLIEIEEPGT